MKQILYDPLNNRLIIVYNPLDYIVCRGRKLTIVVLVIVG